MKNKIPETNSNKIRLILYFVWDSLIVILCSALIYFILRKLLNLPLWLTLAGVIFFGIVTGKKPKLLRPWEWFKQSP